MTQRLYYSDAYCAHFDATVVDVKHGDVQRVYLDRTAFYPTSGGQPHDVGRLGAAEVLDVVDEGERVAHIVRGDVGLGAVSGSIDWARRYDLMQQHSGQHLLSALFADSLGAPTLSVHFGDVLSTLDVDTQGLSNESLRALERRANEVVWENRPLSVTFEDAATAQGLRKASERGGELRIVTIEGVDRSACGGTHVRSTSEIGPVLLRRTERMKKALRIEFVCGGRALKRAQADYALLTRMAQAASTAVDDLGGVFDAQLTQLRDGESVRRKLAEVVDRYRAQELYAGAPADALGVRRVVERCASGTTLEDVRGLALRFADLPRAVFIATTDAPAALLVAASADAGVNAGELLRTAVTPHGGRGGGSPRLAQGTVPNAAALSAALAAVSAQGAAVRPSAD